MWPREKEGARTRPSEREGAGERRRGRAGLLRGGGEKKRERKELGLRARKMEEMFFLFISIFLYFIPKPFSKPF